MSKLIYVLVKKDDEDNKTPFESAEALYNLIVSENIKGDVYEYDYKAWTTYHNAPFWDEVEYPDSLDDYNTAVWADKVLHE
jgi:hypothetical protein